MNREHSGARRMSALHPVRLASAVVLCLGLLAAGCKDSSQNVSAPSTVAAPLFATAPTTSGTGFAVLANAAATCTNGTINGSVGTFQAPPTGSFTQTACPVTGAIDVGNSAAVTAYNNFVASYVALAPAPGDGCTALSGTLDGVTLAPGTYCFPAAAALTGTLTLAGPANGIWVFKIGADGTGALTGTNFSVVMTGGGQACNVTWWVAQAATMTTSHFQGNILAGAAITLTGGTFNGNAWSQADVTVTGTTMTACAGATVDQHGNGRDKQKCNQGVGNGPEGCDPGNSDHHNPSNDENGGVPGNPGRKDNR